jgi:hypothetical protein
VHVEVSDNGDSTYIFHMHSSSVFGSFDFNLRGYLAAAGFPTAAFVQSGHVGADGAIGSQWWDAAPQSGWGDHVPFAITPGAPAAVLGQKRQLGGPGVLAKS